MTSVLVKVRGDGGAFRAAVTRAFGSAGLELQPILTVPPTADGLGLAADPATWLRVSHPDVEENPWETAHRLMERGSPFAAARSRVEAAEPDLEQVWPWDTPARTELGFGAAPVCAFDDQNASGGLAKGPGPAWNLGDHFSQLRAAREKVGARQSNVLIAQLDTGFDPRHETLPEGLRLDLQRNFVSNEAENDASDQGPDGKLSNRGHGTGTLSILAGNKLDGTVPGFKDYTDYLGGAPLAGVMPIRIADWVVRFSLSSMILGIDYARTTGAHVLSMSMGGVSSQALVDAVNRAYDAGLMLVTAAGNNLAGLPSPKSIVFPARLRRVLAACGVMADGRAYAGLAVGTMQGNFGPPEKMKTAIGAYTPNVPWAQIGCGSVVDMDGAGTSAATPQVAAAAALWIAEHWDTVQAYPEPWMRIEAARRALFRSAQKSTPRMSPAETHEKLGQGVLRALDALAEAPPRARDLVKLPLGESTWPWLNLVFGGGVNLAEDKRRAMFALELTQMAQRVAEVEAAMPEPEGADPPPAACNRYLEAALDAGKPSKPLSAALERHLGRKAVPPPKPPSRIPRKVVEPEPPQRRLRVYALDPSIAKSLDTIDVNETTILAPWDDAPLTPEPLRPGPVGEYLEVVDVDPASGKVYAPVDLNDKALLAQNGLPPSEGNPKFHQQMVYAVGMQTIGFFERALGRRVMWAPRRATDADGRASFTEVRRLRIYPHALRTANAYYSPAKKALLFGYFPGGTADSLPGSMVFTCLSSDIVAHEMTHALLDGMHRRLQEPSNPDVRAFHEGFADIVAVFQHFTIGELVRFEIGRARGDLSVARLLSGLARQFGQGSGVGGALRDYTGPNADTRTYDRAAGAHALGEILVLAVYDAFLAIVGRRTADLIRIATGGTGQLADSALHPDLVNRLAEETCAAARHVLDICILALDYCPSVDITFGEYLRALITADIDLRAEDPLGSRIAFMEAFQKRGIPVRDVRTISTESLVWNAPMDDQPDWLRTIFGRVEIPFGKRLTRSEIFDLDLKNRWRVWEAFRTAFAETPDLCKQFGLRREVPRYERDGTPRSGRPVKGTTFEIFSVRPARRTAPDGDVRVDILAVLAQRRPEPIVEGGRIEDGFFWFRSGSTLVLDSNLGQPRIRYNIVKSAESARRLAIQRSMAATGLLSPLRSLYFGADEREPFALLHEGHRGQRHG